MKCFAVLLQTRSRVREKKLFDPSKATGGFSGRRIKVYTRAVVRERKRRCGQRRAEDREKTENSGNDPAHVTGVKKDTASKGAGKEGRRTGTPLLSRSPSVEAMIVSSCYTRRSGVIRFKKKEREV